ncbi:hypothetical protein, partial [Acidovorax cavernicola]|uniref:hypothetical protein n=1 Tax=Acidovorax cavernicola TaxID=1675792 RepID=UPI00142E0F97
VNIDHVLAGGEIVITADGAITGPSPVPTPDPDDLLTGGPRPSQDVLDTSALVLTLSSDSSNDTEDRIEDSMDEGAKSGPQEASAAIGIVPAAKVTYTDLPVSLQMKEGL